MAGREAELPARGYATSGESSSWLLGGSTSASLISMPAASAGFGSSERLVICWSNRRPALRAVAAQALRAPQRPRTQTGIGAQLFDISMLL
jgi:hypothetical protein